MIEQWGGARTGDGHGSRECDGEGLRWWGRGTMARKGSRTQDGGGVRPRMVGIMVESY
jgi:hypothetical protein